MSCYLAAAQGGHATYETYMQDTFTSSSLYIIILKQYKAGDFKELYDTNGLNML